MPASMQMQQGDMPSRRRLSYDERRGKERKRFILVAVVTFAVVLFVGAGVIALHFVRGRAAPWLSVHSASN